jgi:hypothetical protein
MNNHLNPHGATPAELKEQELADSLIPAEFALFDSKTIEEKKKALDLVNGALGEIEKFNGEAIKKDSYAHLNWCHPVDEVQWDNQSWAEQRG